MTHTPDPHADPHHAAATEDHGDDHGHDEHGHGAAELGPINVQAWAAGLLGLLVAILTAACFGFTTGAI